MTSLHCSNELAGESLAPLRRSPHQGPVRFEADPRPREEPATRSLWKSTRFRRMVSPSVPTPRPARRWTSPISSEFELGRRRRQRRKPAPSARSRGRTIVTASGNSSTAAGIPTTEAAIVDATVGRLPLAEGQRDRRREASPASLAPAW